MSSPEPDRGSDGVASAAPSPAAAVAASLAELDRLSGRPLGEHVAAFERVHAALAAALGSGPADEG